MDIPEIKKKLNPKILKPCLVVAILLLIVADAFCIYKYMYCQKQYKENQIAYTALVEEYTAKKPISTTNGTNKAEAEKSPISVDFNLLEGQAARGKIAAWLYSEGTVINYPVVHCDDNAFYLDHHFDGSYNSCGTLFIDCKCAGDFTDRNTIIYGHHMADGQMFHSLKQYRRDENYYKEHPTMYINTPGKDYKLEIYSTFVCETEDLAFKVNFANDDEFQQFIDYTVNSSLIKSDIKVSTSDHIVTLVTCSYETNNARTIVCGILKSLG